MPFSALEQTNEADILQDLDQIDYPLDGDGEELYATLSGSNKTLGVFTKELFGIKKVMGEKNRRHGSTKINGRDISLLGLISTIGTQVNGTGTDFTKLNDGDWIGLAGGVYRCVQSVISPTQAVLYQPFPIDLTNQPYVRMRTMAERLDLIEASIKQIGEPLFLRKLTPISTAFPYWNLKTSNTDLDSSNFPDYVPYLQSILVNIDGTTVFPVTGYTATGADVTIQLQVNAVTDLLLKMLTYDKDINGGFSTWKCLTIDNLIGNITAGDYPITGIDLINRTLTFPSTATASAGVGTMRIYHHRVAGQPTKARHFKIEGRSIISSKDFKYAYGFRIPDSLQETTVIQDTHNHIQDAHLHSASLSGTVDPSGDLEVYAKTAANAEKKVGFAGGGGNQLAELQLGGSVSGEGDEMLLYTKTHSHGFTGGGGISPATATNQSATATNQSFSSSGSRTDDVTRSESIIYEMYEFVGTYIP